MPQVSRRPIRRHYREPAPVVAPRDLTPPAKSRTVVAPSEQNDQDESDMESPDGD